MTLKPKRIIPPVVIIAVIIILINIFFGKNDDIHIGISGPMSGKNKLLGQVMVDCARFYFKKINASGGIDGKKVKIIPRDSLNMPSVSKENAEAFARNKKISAVIGHRYSSHALAAKDVYKKYGLVNITPTASNPKITKGSTWNYRMLLDDTYQAHFVATYSKNVFSAKKVSVIYSNTPYGKSLSGDFIKQAKKIGIKIIGQYMMNKGESFNTTDTIVNTLKQSDVVYLALHYGDGITVMKSLYKKKINTRFIGGDSIGGSIFSHQGGKEVEGVYGVNCFLPDILGLKARTFITDFIKEYGYDPDWGGALTYDACLLLSRAFTNKGTDRTSVRDYLKSLNSTNNSVQGLSGNLFFDKDGNCMRIFYMGQVNGGRYRSAKIQLSYVKNIKLLKSNEKKSVFKFKGLTMEKTSVVYSGIFINKLESFNAKESEFTVDFLIWFRWWGEMKEIDFKFIQAEELTREINDKFTDPETGEKYSCYKIRAKFSQDFSFRKYPFDSHILQVRLRHSTLPAHKLKFVIDVPDMELSERQIEFEDWINISQLNFVEYINSLHSIRNPRTEKKKLIVEYPIYNFHVQVKRVFLPYLVKFVLPLLFILAVSFLAFFIHPREFETNVAIGITALLSAIAFHITQGENLPNIGYVVTADLFFILTYGLIFLSIVESVISNNMFHNGDIEGAVKIDKVSIFLFPILLVLIIGVIILWNN